MRPQAPSTSFDPAPQFAIHAVQTVEDGKAIVTGHCAYEPFRVGSVFTRVAVEDDGGWAVVPCRLEVDSIALYYLYVDELEQTHSARVWLFGDCDVLAVAQDTAQGRPLLLVG